ncbi:MAG TPA: immunoglobulin domain-containing protein, partial [Verrucomicrobiae bacterium]
TAPTKDGPRPNAVAAESGTHVYWMCHGKHVAAAADQITAQEIQVPFEAYANVGLRTALIMRVDFSDLPGASAATNAVDDTINTVDSFLGQNSFGDLHFKSHTVTPVLRMPRASSAYGDPTANSGDSLLLNDARNAARTAGFNPDNFDFDIVAFVDIGFPWSGQGYVGSKGAWIQGNFAGATVGHELGHNLGLWHANSWNSNESAISPNGSHEEYGNPFDVMGRSTVGFPNTHYSANFKRLLGWLSPANVTVVNASGTYRIYAHDENSRLAGRSYALNIPVGISAGDETEDYWIDFRQLLTSLYPATANGAILQWGNDSGTKSASRLLDMNFATSTKTDSPLTVGQTFNDPDRGLQITPLAKTGNGPGAYLDIQITLIAPPVVDLGEALDNTNFNWVSSAPAWTGQRSVSHDGVDAAASAPIRDDSETFFETTIKGPGALFFWWKVSSEQDFDFLQFIVDDEPLTSISGQVDWQKRGYELPSGPHTVRWLYKKDGGSSAGADRGWVDEISFISGDHPPFINAQPASLTAALGDTAEIHIDAIGSAPLTYQWQKISDTGDPVDVPNATNATLTLPNVQSDDAGLYDCVVSNGSGTITSANALLTVIHFVSLAEALDDTDATWSSSTNAWTGQQAVTHDGIDAAQSAAIPNGKDSSLTASITGPGTLSFWWKVSSEPDYDLFSLYLDGDLIENHSGEFDWTQKSLVIPNGVHTVRWTYAKDANLSQGQDAAWVDQVTFTPLVDIAPQFINEPAPQAVSIGGTAMFTARYSAAEPTAFTWFKDGVALEPRANFIGLTTDTLCITNVQASDAGIYTLRIANSFGFVTSSGAALTIVPISLADAVDQPL